MEFTNLKLEDEKYKISANINYIYNFYVALYNNLLVPHALM